MIALAFKMWTAVQNVFRRIFDWNRIELMSPLKLVQPIKFLDIGHLIEMDQSIALRILLTLQS